MGALPSMPRVANDCLSQVERGALEVRASGAVFEALYYAVEDHPDRARVTAADCEAATAAHVAQMLP